MTEQSAPDSDITSRLTAVFGGPAPEVAPEPEQPEPQIEAEQAEAAPDDTPDEPQEAEDPSLVEIDLGDGEVVRGPQKLKDAVERQRDYTVKTQELAVQRKAVEDKAQYVEAREKLISTVQDEIGEYKSLQAQHKQYETLDWDAIYSANPGQALKLRDQRDDLARQIAEKSQAIQQKAQQAQAMQQQHMDQQWKLAAEGARQRIGKFTADDDLAMAQQARALGFDDNEIKAKLADSRLLHALYKAAKWDALQAGKSAAVQTAQKAPPVLKPGAANTNTQAVQKDKALRDRVKKSGNINDVARLLASRMR